ncbi:DUF882 domain-containing protein [Hoeflea sp. YIM 152468]|uniref:DUF882 domain-containing protein n=1 Tax=Hoeflea sp. YIM 152468 TaxID=3031759 RepID=UPI0023DCA949|nr:DUF882 domain-containing protein [Hoeflea sp. YIM 152468]MDF1607899.1 DUF882 domain-containing protein [Hoeflea sp. YIM 152468]
MAGTVRIGLLMMIAVCAGLMATPEAKAETRSLKLYYIHTKEKAEIVFKRNGRYDQAGLAKLNRFLRDWRRNEPTKMDPRLFDLVWEVYRQVGAKEYINVISAYRSPATNDMLRRTRGGQAKKSQHMLGRALDFYIPGVSLSKLRAAAMKVQGGGVGYYPKSGSPFVHLDVAGVRAWPRMSRQELSKIFPDGKTLHLPPDGKPLPGYQTALAEYKRRGGAIASAPGGDSDSSAKRSGGLLAALFGGGDEDEEPEAIAAAPKPAPAPPQTEIAALPGVLDAPAQVAPPADAVTLPVRAPIPVARPVIEQPVVLAALAPPEPVLPAQAEINAFAAAAANAGVEQEQPAGIELASIRAPIPLLLAERAGGASPEPEAGPVEMAALPVPSLIRARMQTDEVEQPAADVQVAEALIERAAETAPAGLSQSAAAALAALPSGDDFVPLPIRRPGDRASDQKPAAARRDIEMASLMPVPAQRGARVGASAKAISTSRRGDRPTAAAVAQQPQRTSIRTEPKLTETIISKWALAQDSVQSMATPPGKARHFVVSQLRAAPKIVYASGFAPDGGDLPHSQFSGSAVNFINVARFGN